ncbi:MAG TPA: S-methyl-5-thioribose-1-phosphate isomerase [Pirellulales bacterium]|jgi:methylthioribose-1-phosphate isomerase|nr:S-methyl-5-thioribose-1-phosphate isomerase [Pirellulales bacterium]
MSIEMEAPLTSATIPATLDWVGEAEGCLRLIDQTRLPNELVYLDCHDVETVFEAIRSLRVRGAPAIGVAAAYGVCVGLQGQGQQSLPQFFEQLRSVCRYLASSRPTAVNLFWALDRMERIGLSQRGAGSAQEVYGRLLTEARAIHEEDRQMCRAIGRHGAELLVDGQGVLTHCNAGGLATSDYGTALAVIFAASEQGKRLHVYADETRPLLQGARLTAWELQQRGIPATLICDSMAAQVMREGRVQAVVVGADRIAANGDTANKIGTYGVAVLADYHNIPFYVAAPTSTFDLTLESGEGIPIEQRAAEEITAGFGRRTAPLGMPVYNPAFDVTPARLIRGIVCERGLIEPVDEHHVLAMIAGE